MVHNLLKLRKKNKLSQEEIAIKLNVSRQTIFNWEKGESVPNLQQAKKLSNIFNISLDELVDNNVKDSLSRKMNNTEKLANMTIRVLKITSYLTLLLIVSFICFYFYKLNINKGFFIKDKKSVECYMEEMFPREISIYRYKESPNGYFKCKRCMEEEINDITKYINYYDLEESLDFIKAYFRSKGGAC